MRKALIRRKPSNKKIVTILERKRGGDGFLTYIPTKKITMEHCFRMIATNHANGRDSEYCYKYRDNNEADIIISIDPKSGTIHINRKDF